MTRKSAARRISQPSATIQHEPQPAPAPSKVRNIALGLLVLSPANVRKTPPTAAEDAQLEASIRARGIPQNLIVHPAPVEHQDIYEVDAGGRRLKVEPPLHLYPAAVSGSAKHGPAAQVYPAAMPTGPASPNRVFLFNR